MTKLLWLLSWILESDKDPVPEQDELAWRAACVRNMKLSVFMLCAAYAVWAFGGFLAKRAAQPREGLGQVVWVGDDSYSSGSPGSGMHASASHRVERDGARVLLDGSSEPVEYTTGPNSALRRLAVGERVRVNYRQGTWLFWEALSVTAISKLTDVDGPGPSHRAP